MAQRGTIEFKPFGNRIVVRQDLGGEQKTDGGIILAETTEAAEPPMTGEIVAVGPEAAAKGAAIGQRISFMRFAGVSCDKVLQSLDVKGLVFLRFPDECLAEVVRGVREETDTERAQREAAERAKALEEQDSETFLANLRKTARGVGVDE